MLDEHCHIVWDVDDGSDSLEESLDMLAEAARVGITQIVATPHMRWSDFDNDKVISHFDKLADVAMKRHGIQMWLGYEVFYKTLLKQGLHTAPLYVTEGTNNLRLEFNSGGVVEDGWEKVFYELQTTYGLDLTIAHTERYASVLDDFDIVYRMRDMGCRIEVSAGDLFGGFFNASAKCAKRILDEGLCDALVSDAHCAAHYRDFEKALKKLG